MNAHRGKDLVYTEHLLPFRGFDTQETLLPFDRHAEDFRFHHGLDFRLSEGTSHHLRDLLILKGQELCQCLDDGHLRPHRFVKERELRTDSARADHNQALWLLLLGERLTITDNALAIYWKLRDLTRPRSRSDDDIRTFEGLAFLAIRDL